MVLNKKINQPKERCDMDMKCARCNTYGIYWKSLHTGHPYTFCPNCKSINCQVQDEEIEEEEQP